MICLTPGCGKGAAAALKRGLCMKCHSEAKKQVNAGNTTWEQLEQMGLAQPAEQESTFARALKEKKQQFGME